MSDVTVDVRKLEERARQEKEATPRRVVDLDGADIELVLTALHSELEVLGLLERRGIVVDARRVVVSSLMAKLRGGA